MDLRSKARYDRGDFAFFTFSELKKFDTLDDARAYLVELEASDVLRLSHVDQFEYFEKKLKISLRVTKIGNVRIRGTNPKATSHCSHWRHCIQSIHYRLQKARNRCSRFKKRRSDCDIAVLFRRSSLLLTRDGTKACICSLEEIRPSDRKAIENHINKISLDLIDAERYHPAINVMEFALNSPIKLTSQRSRLVCTVNLAQAHKWNGNEEQCRQILSSEDWSAASQDFILAVAVLEDRHLDACRIMDLIGSSGTITKRDYDRWPLFRKFRETTEFLGVYSKIFAGEAETKQIPIELPPHSHEQA